MLRNEVDELGAVLAHLDAGGVLRDYPGGLPPALEPLTTMAILDVVNGPVGIDLKLEAELSELPEEEAAAFREGPSALDEVVRRLTDALDLITFFTAGDNWPRRRRGEIHRRGGSSIPTSRAASSAARSSVGTSSSTPAALGGGQAWAAAARGEDVSGRGRRRAQHPLQRLSPTRELAAAISAAPASAAAAPTRCQADVRSLRTSQASATVTTG